MRFSTRSAICIYSLLLRNLRRLQFAPRACNCSARANTGKRRTDVRQQAAGYAELTAQTRHEFLFLRIGGIGYQVRRRDHLRRQLCVVPNGPRNLFRTCRMGDGLVEKRALVGAESRSLHLRDERRALRGVDRTICDRRGYHSSHDDLCRIVAVIVRVKARTDRRLRGQLFEPRHAFHERLVLLPIGERLVRYSAERREPAELDCPRGNAPSRGRSQKQCGETSCCGYRGRGILLGKIFRLGDCVANGRALKPFLRLCGNARESRTGALCRSGGLLRGLPAQDRIE